MNPTLSDINVALSQLNYETDAAVCWQHASDAAEKLTVTLADGTTIEFLMKPSP